MEWSCNLHLTHQRRSWCVCLSHACPTSHAFTRRCWIQYQTRSSHGLQQPVPHIMAGLPAAPGDWHGSASRGAEAVVKSCVGRPESAVSAVRNVLHAAVQQHPHVAGELMSDDRSILPASQRVCYRTSHKSLTATKVKPGILCLRLMCIAVAVMCRQVLCLQTVAMTYTGGAM